VPGLMQPRVGTHRARPSRAALFRTEVRLVHGPRDSLRSARASHFLL
jgi:hypothetical protein